MKAKRFLTGLLTAAMVLSSLPMTAFAAESTPEVIDAATSKLQIAGSVETQATSADEFAIWIGDTGYESIPAAIEKANEGDVIKLAAGIYDAFKIPDDKDGITIQAADPDNKPVIRTMYEGSPTFTPSGCGGIDLYASDITLKDLKIEGYGVSTNGWYCAPIGTYYEVVTDKNGLKIDGCEITYKGDGVGGTAITLAGITELTITGCTIEGFTSGYYAEGSYAGSVVDLKFTNNNVDVVENALAFIPYSAADGSSVTITGNTINAGKIVLLDYGVTSANVPALKNIVIRDNGVAGATLYLKDLDDSVAAIDAGDMDYVRTYSSVEKALAYGPAGVLFIEPNGKEAFYINKINADTYEEAVETAKIGDTVYYTLQDAIAAAMKNGGEIVLLKNVDVNKSGIDVNCGALEINKGTFTINGNGFEIIAKNLAGADTSKMHLFNVTETADVTFKNLTIDGAGIAKHGINVFGENTAVTLDSVTVENCKGYGVCVNGGIVTADGLATAGNGWGGVNIDKKDFNDAVFTMNSGEILDANAVYVENADGSAILNGGIFHGLVSTDGNGGTVTLNGGSYASTAATMTEDEVKAILTAFVAEGYALVGPVDDYFTVEEIYESAELTTDMADKNLVAGAADWTEFNVTVAANDDAGKWVQFAYGIYGYEEGYTFIEAMEYLVGEEWVSVPRAESNPVEADEAVAFEMYDGDVNFRVKLADTANGEEGLYLYMVDKLNEEYWKVPVAFTVAEPAEEPAEDKVTVLVPVEGDEEGGKATAVVDLTSIADELDAVTGADAAVSTLVLKAEAVNNVATTDVLLGNGVVAAVSEAANKDVTVRVETTDGYVTVNQAVMQTVAAAADTSDVILRVADVPADEQPAKAVYGGAISYTFVKVEDGEETEISVPANNAHGILVETGFFLPEGKTLDQLTIGWTSGTRTGVIARDTLDDFYTMDLGDRGVLVWAAFTVNHLTDFYLVDKPVSVGGGGGGGGSTSYTISADKDIENGSVTVKGSAEKGNTVTITVKPDEGYALDKLTVTDKDGKEIEVTDNGDGTFTFKMPAGKVEIDATFKEAAAAPVNPADAEGAIVLTVGNTEATVDGEKVTNDVAPIIRNERTMLPIRFIAEALGATVAWNDETDTVTITKEGLVIEIVIGQDYATVNGERVALDAPAFIENSRTYLPIRFVAENLGAAVTWDNDTKQVIIVPNK